MVHIALERTRQVGACCCMWWRRRGGLPSSGSGSGGGREALGARCTPGWSARASARCPACSVTPLCCTGPVRNLSAAAAAERAAVAPQGELQCFRAICAATERCVHPEATPADAAHRRQHGGAGGRHAGAARRRSGARARGAGKPEGRATGLLLPAAGSAAGCCMWDAAACYWCRIRVLGCTCCSSLPCLAALPTARPQLHERNVQLQLAIQQLASIKEFRTPQVRGGGRELACAASCPRRLPCQAAPFWTAGRPLPTLRPRRACAPCAASSSPSSCPCSSAPTGPGCATRPTLPSPSSSPSS